MAALLKDKKNSSTKLGLVLPVGATARIEMVMITPDKQFMKQLRAALVNLT
jgi:hypothetical protein